MTLEARPKFRRASSTCHRHPAEPVTGICASCLRDRLSRVDPAARGESSAASTAIKGGVPGTSKRNDEASSSPPELRRSKSLSVGGKCEGSSEPRRRSCDVRARHTLWHLFNLDDETRDLGNLGFSGDAGTIVESKAEDERGEEINKIRVSEAVLVRDADVEDVEEEVEPKTMREHIDLEWQNMKHSGRDLKDIAGSFWVAASVFSKKLGKWQQRQKMKKLRRGCGGDGGGSVPMQVEKPSRGQLRDTQSEVGDYGFGRRSCDTDPRFSVDAGFDEPRASWDGYLIGRPIQRLPPVATVVENGSAPVQGLDNRVEERKRSTDGDEKIPGRCSVRRQRRSFDWSRSNRKIPVVEGDEMKLESNARVSPATVDLFHGTKLLVMNDGLRSLNSNSPHHSCSEGFESASGDSASVVNSGNGKEFKKPRRWQKAWNVWGLMHRHKFRDEERCYRGNEAGNSIGESWVNLGRGYNSESERGCNGMLVRSRSCVGSQTFCSLSSDGESREIRSHSKKRREFVLDRNQTVRQSASDLDNGLLRFYLTPLRSYRKSKSGKSRLKDSRSILRSILRLY
ncbi:protein OCTOPUS [Malania oleifera]|uniref:protein OCTOPUS n=1 Tax=Malania oleifera TaxID=397392 RepID=UPI0025ADFAA3|nr:protein OCTOPUS [Malania oleifera]